MNNNMQYKIGDVIKHKGHERSVGLVVEVMEAYSTDDIIRHMSGNSYQVYWTVGPPGDNDLDECWYPEEHLIKFTKEL